jgi:hypothetical protein
MRHSWLNTLKLSQKSVLDFFVFLFFWLFGHPKWEIWGILTQSTSKESYQLSLVLPDSCTDMLSLFCVHCRAVHDYEYIQIQFNNYGIIMIKIWLQCCNLHSPTGPLGLRISPCGVLVDSA